MAKTINTTAINNAVTKALGFARSFATCVEDLRTMLADVTRDEASDIITPAVAKAHGIGYDKGQRGLTFDKDHAAFEAARKDRQRLLTSIYGAAGRSTHKAPAVQRFEKQRVAQIQGALIGLSKAQAKAYLAKAFEGLSFE